MKTLGPCNVWPFVAQSHTPCNCCVRFAPTVASGHATLATKQDASPLLGPDFHRLDRTSFRLAHSFDHLVGGSEQGRRDGDAEHRGGLDVEDQLELARLYNRQVGGLRTLEDAAGVR